jgi:hypothetical protein
MGGPACRSSLIGWAPAHGPCSPYEGADRSKLLRIALLFIAAAALVRIPSLPAEAAPATSNTCSLRSCTALLTVDRAGIYRITGSYLRQHGFDWSHLPGNELALQLEGQKVPRFVSTTGPLDDRSYLEFYASSFHTRYTTRAVYTLSVDRHQALAATTVPASPGRGASLASFSAHAVESRRTVYDPSAPGEGWFFAQLATTGDRVDTSATIRLPGLLATGTASLDIAVRGVTDLSGTGPQHHLQALVNGHPVTDAAFSGTDERTIDASFSASWLDARKTTVQFVLPGDVRNQYTTDIVEIRTFVVTYPRSFTASGGGLTAQILAPSTVTVDGFRSQEVSVWRTSPGVPARLTGVHAARSNHGFSISFSASAAAYTMTDASALRQPAGIARMPSTGYLGQGRATLLIIAPRAFFAPLQPLVAYHRTTDRITVKLADIADIFARYSGGVFDPAAVRTYIRLAARRLGVRSVLLVGSDTYDYHRYLGCSARTCPANQTDLSIIPSIYTRDPYFGQIPSDEMYVDATTGPTVALGRIPAVDEGQVRAAVTKTLNILRARPSRLRAVFAAGGGDPAFPQSSATLATLLPAAYTREETSVAQAGPQKARGQLLQGIDAASILVNYVGHGSLEQWGQPPEFLTVDDVPHLSNSQPSMFLGWGCQTAYHVDPQDASLNARLLFAAHGAFLTLGSTGLDLPQPQTELATRFFHELFHDPAVSTIGEALRRAEIQVLASDPQARQVVDSYELFGDPAIPVATVRGR